MATGENNTTWGDVTNVNLGTTMEEAIVGTENVPFTTADVTLSLSNSNVSQSTRNLRLNLTGTPASAFNLIVPTTAGTLSAAFQKPYIINNTTGRTITVKTAGGTGVAVPTGKTMWVYADGTNVVDVVTHLSSVTLGSALPIASGGTGSTSTTFCNVQTNVVGTLPIANGGTGSTSTTFCNVQTNVVGTLPVANGGTGVTTLGTGVVTALGVNTGTAGAFVVNGGVLGTPSSGTLTNCTFPTLNQSTTGSAATLTTARTLTIGSTGKTFNGSANVSWTLGEIGAAASGANTDITALDQDITITATGTIAANTIGYRGIPQNAQSSTYTFALSDAGSHVYSTNSGAQTITVPTNASVAFPIGTAVTVVNNGTTAITFTTTGVTVYKAGTSTAWASGGTVAVRGLVTWLKVATDTWFVSGAGLS
jgi:hypothetical protein